MLSDDECGGEDARGEKAETVRRLWVCRRVKAAVVKSFIVCAMALCWCWGSVWRAGR